MTKRERIPAQSDQSPAFGRVLVPARTFAVFSAVVKGVAALALFILVTGCGRMGDPIPPNAALLAAPGKPVLIGSGQSLILSWQPPYTTAAGKRAPAPTGYLVERSVWGAGQESCDECADKTSIVAELDAEKLRLEGKSAERWIDTDLSPGVTYGYRIYPLDHRARQGNPSELSRLSWRMITPPQVSATSGDGSAHLTYSPPDRILAGTAARGLAVYDEAGKLVLQLPFSSGGDEQHTGVVTGLENGKSYRFAGRWVVTTAQGWQLQSPPVYFTVTPTDTTSPEPPRDLAAFGDRDSIALNWFVPRGERYSILIIERMVVVAGEGAEAALPQWQVVARVDGARMSYKDSLVEPGVRYRYRIISQDSAGNVSAPSSETSGRRLGKR